MAKSAPNNRHQPSEAAGSDDYLIDVSADSSNHELLVLTHCPICHTRLIDDLDDYKHSESDPVADHIATHSPADLDVDGPYHFTPMADILIRLHGLEAD
jgi:hypothetical protein